MLDLLRYAPVGPLDVLASTPAAPSQSQALYLKYLRPLATTSSEKSGLGL